MRHTSRSQNGMPSCLAANRMDGGTRPNLYRDFLPAINAGSDLVASQLHQGTEKVCQVAWIYHRFERNSPRPRSIDRLIQRNLIFLFSGCLLSCCSYFSHGLHDERNRRGSVPASQQLSSRTVLHIFYHVPLDYRHIRTICFQDLPAAFLTCNPSKLYPDELTEGTSIPVSLHLMTFIFSS